MRYPEKIDRSKLPSNVTVTKVLVLPREYTIDTTTGGMFPEELKVTYTAVGSWHSEVFKFVSGSGDTVFYDTTTEMFCAEKPERCGPKARFALISTQAPEAKAPADDPKTEAMMREADTYAEPEEDED